MDAAPFGYLFCNCYLLVDALRKWILAYVMVDTYTISWDLDEDLYILQAIFLLDNKYFNFI